jgi:hypothetical protein
MSTASVISFSAFSSCVGTGSPIFDISFMQGSLHDRFRENTPMGLPQNHPRFFQAGIKRIKSKQMGDSAPLLGMMKGGSLGQVLLELSEKTAIRHVMDMKNTPARAVRNMVQPAKAYGLASMRQLLDRMGERR